MSWQYWAIAGAGSLALAVLLGGLAVRLLGRREPYAAFFRLRPRRKLTFFRLLLQDSRVPLYVKVLPLLVAAYLASPIDLLPGIPVDDVALALLALALIIRLTPRHVLEDVARRAAEADAPPSSPGGTTPRRH